MRQIKFRLWDKANNQMINGKNIGVLLKNINNNDSHVYQQWTGLLDKEGVEIYEGDIVSQAFADALPQTFGESMKFKIGNTIGAICWAYDCWRIDDIDSEALINIMSHCKIIGNIYENKEILEIEL